MKAIYYTLLFSCILLLSPSYVLGVGTIQKVENQELSNEEATQKAFDNLSPKKQKRLKKRMAKLNKKLKKKAALDSGVFQDSKFRLGALCVLGGLVLILLASLFIGFTGIVFWVGDLAVLIGIILMVWAIIDYA